MLRLCSCAVYRGADTACWPIRTRGALLGRRRYSGKPGHDPLVGTPLNRQVVPDGRLEQDQRLGLFCLNIAAVLSYWYVLKGVPAALDDHLALALLLGMLMTWQGKRWEILNTTSS